MFMTRRLEVTDSNFGGDRLEFYVHNEVMNQYLTERFELYSQHNKYIFSHITGCSSAEGQINHKIFLRQNKNKTIYIIQILKASSNEWTHINKKRLRLCNILRDKDE